MSRGQPLWWCCPNCRQRTARRVVRTGKHRAYKRRNGCDRIASRKWEYTCPCGHVGWSAHQDIAAGSLWGCTDVAYDARGHKVRTACEQVAERLDARWSKPQ